MLKDLFTGFCDLVFPPNCLICRQHLTKPDIKTFLCEKCFNSIKQNSPPFCPKCSRYLGIRPHSSRCSHCIKIQPNFDFAWSSCIYKEPLKGLIIRYKYHQKTLLRHDFSKIMINFINKYYLDIDQFDLIIPVPLSSTRLRERSYNQSLLLAKLIANKYQIKLSTNNLKRSKHTTAHALLNEKERWTNIRGAFRIKYPDQYINKNILIIDDLLTTGATTSEIAKILKRSGAKTVAVFTLAIAL